MLHQESFEILVRGRVADPLTLSTSGERGMETTFKKCNGCTPTRMANIKKADNCKC